MKYLDLIGSDLKSDFLNDLFETYDVAVIYDYDRTHESVPDYYRAAILDLGLQFVFDADQKFFTLFIDQKEVKSWNPFEPDERLMNFSSKDAARKHARKLGFDISEGTAEFMGELKDWIRFNLEGYSIHYEFVDSNLKKITIQKEN